MDKLIQTTVMVIAICIALTAFGLGVTFRSFYSEGTTKHINALEERIIMLERGGE